MPRITSSDNPRLKQAMRLIASSRDRRKAALCVLEGAHLITAYMQRHGPPETLIVIDSAVDGAAQRTLPGGIPVSRVLTVSASTWVALTQLPVDVAMLAVVPTPSPKLDRVGEFCLLLEDLQDPGNVGSILRTAAAAGVAQVFMSGRCAFAWSPKVLRAAQGGHFQLDIFEDVDLVALVRGYRGTTIATIAAGGEPLFTTDLRPPVAIALGNEGAGLSAELRAAATRLVTIPMPGKFESLNAAAAAAVCVFECVRQRGAERRE